MTDKEKDILEALKAAGLPVDQWQAEIEEKREANPTAEWRPFTSDVPVPKYSKIRGLRPGFEEFKPFKRWPGNHMMRRCQAAKKRTNGEVQCMGHATRWSYLCKMHGGAKRIGKSTEQGIANRIASLTKHGRETVAMKEQRAANRKLLKQIDEAMKGAVEKADIKITNVRAPKSRTKSKASRKPKNG